MTGSLTLHGVDAVRCVGALLQPLHMGHGAVVHVDGSAGAACLDGHGHLRKAAGDTGDPHHQQVAQIPVNLIAVVAVAAAETEGISRLSI